MCFFFSNDEKVRFYLVDDHNICGKGGENMIPMRGIYVTPPSLQQVRGRCKKYLCGRDGRGEGWGEVVGWLRLKGL